MVMNFQAMSVLLIISVTIILAATTKLSTAEVQRSRNCKTTCGNLTNINFPFGMSEGCYLDKKFRITCNKTYKPPRAFYGVVQVLNISHECSEMVILHPVSHICYNPSGDVMEKNITLWSENSAKFPFSPTRNNIIGVGCGMFGAITGENYITGCILSCDGVEKMVNRSCEEMGCCEIKNIPSEASSFNMALFPVANNSTVRRFNPCSYGFLAENGSYNLNSLDLMNMRSHNEFPVVLDWAVDKVLCSDAKRNKSSYACRSPNSECVDSTNGRGYRCKCSQGFKGNPYLDRGCEDIDECSETPNICGVGFTCSNLPAGSHSCLCPKGYYREDDGGVCREKSQISIWQIKLLGVSISVLLLVMGSPWIYLIVKKRKLMKKREIFFQKNGGFMLRQQLSEQEGSVEKVRIFTTEDLERATNNYDESSIIGQGGFGTVYKGVLLDNREVAIKKSRISDQSQIGQFINEIIILSQINHVNVVKLIGCCLETEVPLLVYEFISNGTLSDHIHNESRASSLSWEMRLKIAAESAGAIAYIHYTISTPIIHRDITSANILLDDNCTPKVSDFGASRLVPLNQTQLTTLVQGTIGYVDPEYFYSNQLTKKSDVYSFGVVLAELLTGKEVISFQRPEEDRNLAMYFVSSVKDDRLVEILDGKLVKEANIEQLKAVAMLIKQCLRVNGEERPTMKEVATELEVIRVTNKHSWAATDFNTEE